MSTQSNIEMALIHWTRGETTKFKELIKHELDNNMIENYKGNGDMLTYFIPALLIEQLWCDLIEVGFPVGLLIERESEIYNWVEWNSSKELLNSTYSSIRDDINNYGIDVEETIPTWFDSDDTNYDITMDYYPSELRSLVEYKIRETKRRTQEVWDAIVEKIKNY